MNHAFALAKRDDERVLIEPSEQKKATEAVERMNRALAERTAELQSALADLRGFSRWVSHDLRSPLRSIGSYTELLAESLDGRMSDSEAHMLERIRTNATRADRLITDILDYSLIQVVGRHGGRVWAESAPGAGAIFCFTLPEVTAPAY